MFFMFSYCSFVSAFYLTARFWRMAATIAVMVEIIVINNAGATTPVMSSSLSQEININVTIPVTVKAARAIAEYFTASKIIIRSCCILFWLTDPQAGSLRSDKLSSIASCDDRAEDNVQAAEACSHH